MLLKTLTTLALAGFISACTNTTHKIALNPELSVESAQLTNIYKINVTSQSLIDEKIGSIKTALNEHADIYISNELTKSMNTNIINGLGSLGFKLEEGKEPSSTLTASITELSYTTETKGLKTIASIHFTLKANLKTSKKHYQASYRSEVTDEYATLPSKEKIQERLNEIASSTVTRLLNDSNIRILLQE